MPSFVRALRFQAILLFCTPVILAIGLEGGLRALHYLKHGTSPLAASTNAMDGSLLFERDPVLGWRTRAHHRAEYGTGLHRVRYTTGAHGFRLYGEHAPDQTRLLFIGDSHTHAVDVSDDDTYYSRLSKRLVPVAEVFAYGSGGYGTLQEVLIIERHLQDVRPNVIILQVWCSEASCHSCGCKSRQHRSPVDAVVISSNGKGDRPVGSLDVKVPDGREAGRIRTGGRANWQAIANV